MSRHFAVSSTLRIPALIVLLLFSGCKRIEKDTPKAAIAAIETVQAEHCPDRRLCVFDVAVEVRGANLKLLGEMSSKEAKLELIDAVKRAVPDFKVEEEIKLLPDPELEQRHAVVSVPVANIRAKPAYSSELVHQQLMGSTLMLLKRHSYWYYAQTEDGYLGWIPRPSVIIGNRDLFSRWQQTSRVAFAGLHGQVRQLPDADSKPVTTVVLGCIMEQDGEQSGVRTAKSQEWMKVRLVDGREGFVEKRLVVPLQELFPDSAQTARELLATAEQFLGIPYLWGGTSPNGFDCSGFTQTVFRLNGISLLRDSSQQGRLGILINAGDEFQNLQPGDLLFFGRNRDRISHVAISLGGARFIHSSGYVRINSLDEDDPDYVEYRRRTYQFAKRLLPSS